MAKALSACDEPAGFITACILVRPNRSSAELDARSVEKMKDGGIVMQEGPLEEVTVGYGY